MLPGPGLSLPINVNSSSSSTALNLIDYLFVHCILDRPFECGRGGGRRPQPTPFFRQSDQYITNRRLCHSARLMECPNELARFLRWAEDRPLCARRFILACGSAAVPPGHFLYLANAPPGEGGLCQPLAFVLTNVVCAVCPCACHRGPLQPLSTSSNPPISQYPISFAYLSHSFPTITNTQIYSLQSRLTYPFYLH